MADYEILNESNEVINVIVADESFVEANYSSYRLRAEPDATEEELAHEARQWRDTELQLTDYIVPLSDHPQRASYMTYRTALRNWPSTSDFPATKPVLG
jgi:hypothetical protein